LPAASTALEWAPLTLLLANAAAFSLITAATARPASAPATTAFAPAIKGHGALRLLCASLAAGLAARARFPAVVLFFSFSLIQSLRHRFSPHRPPPRSLALSLS